MSSISIPPRRKTDFFSRPELATKVVIEELNKQGEYAKRDRASKEAAAAKEEQARVAMADAKAAKIAEERRKLEEKKREVESKSSKVVELDDDGNEIGASSKENVTELKDEGEQENKGAGE
jgi:hypothetical protein